jgi:hypothetical protein
MTDTIVGVIEEVNKVMSEKGSLWEGIKAGIGTLFKGLWSEVMPYLKFAFGALLEQVGQATNFTSLKNAGLSMQVSASQHAPGLNGIMGNPQAKVDRAIHTAIDEVASGSVMGNLGGFIGNGLMGIVDGIGGLLSGNAGGLTDKAVARFRASGANFMDIFGSNDDLRAMAGNMAREKNTTYGGRGFYSLKNLPTTDVQDGLVTSSGQVVKYPKGELLAVLAPQQQMSGGGNGKMELSGTIRLETPAGATNLTMDDFKRLGLHAIAATITHEQNKTEKGYGLNDSKDIKTRLAI